MGVFSIILIVLFAIVCLLLVLMVTIQDQEGEGLGGIFSGAGSAAFGSRSSSVIVRFTYVLGALFFIIALSLAIVNRSRIADIDKAIQTQAGQSSDWATKDIKPEAGSTEQAPAASETPKP